MPNSMDLKSSQTQSQQKGAYDNSEDLYSDIKRNTLKFINVHFSKKISLSRQEEKNLYEQLIFVLSNKFQINNKIITFSYEN